MRCQKTNLFKALVLLGLGVLITIPSMARHHKQQASPISLPYFNEGTVSGLNQGGKFDYYLLSLSWSPAFCLLNNDPASWEQCVSKRFGFIVHGLWPQFEQGYPSDCSANPPPIPESVVKEILPIMPSQDLMRHEWQKHGTCSGLGVNEYFSTLEKAFASINIPPALKFSQIALRIAPSDLTDWFLQSNPKLPKDSIVINCKRGKLSEVKICMDKALQPRLCSADVLKSQCKSQTVLITPIR